MTFERPGSTDDIEQLACRTLLGSIHDGVFTLDREGRFTFVNEFIARSSGFPAQAFLGRSYLELIRPEDRERVRRNFEEALRGRQVPPYELVYRTADGSDMWVEVNTTPLMDDERVVGVLGLSRNIQRRRQAELSLRESEERYRRLVEEMPYGVAIIQDDRLVFTNGGLRRILRIESEERAASADIFAFIVPEDRERLRGQLQRRLAGAPTEPTFYAARLRRADGETFEGELYVRTVQQQGHIAVQCLLIDVSDRLRLEEQLRHTQKMEALGTLAGGIAHDFNNLIAAILGMSELLPRDGDVADIAEGIEKAATQATALTRQLLRFSRRDEVTSEPVDVHVVIRDVMDVLSRSVDPRIRFEWRPCASQTVVQGDVAQLHQVILNLLVNARDAIPGGGRIVVETRNTEASDGSAPNAGPMLEVSVSDSGKGIPAEIADRVFEPFFSTKQSTGGSGMGLAVVYGIVRRHRGTVCLECPAQGGTTFVVQLPTIEKPTSATK